MNDKVKQMINDIDWKNTVILLVVLCCGGFFANAAFTPDTIDDYAILTIKSHSPIYPLYLFRVIFGGILCFWVGLMTMFSFEWYRKF